MNPRILFIGIVSILIVFTASGTAFILMQQPADNDKIFLNVDFSFKIGQSVSFGNPLIIISFSDVFGDSRCPSDVECVWEGTVSLTLEISYEGSNLGEFTLNSSNLHKASFMGYYVKLILLEPYPVSTETIQKADYIGTFILGQYGLD